MLINHTSHAYKRTTGIRVEISEYATELPYTFVHSIKEMPFCEYRCKTGRKNGLKWSNISPR